MVPDMGLFGVGVPDVIVHMYPVAEVCPLLDIPV